MGKVPVAKPLPGVYRDDSDRDDAASMSSAVALGDIEYHDEDLPPYADVPPSSQDALSGTVAPKPSLLPNEIPGAWISSDETTRCAIYPFDLEALIREELKCPPQYFVRIHGTHTETHRTRDNKTEKHNITDFDVKLNLTHLLICKIPSHQADPSKCYEASADNPMPCRYIRSLPEGERGYRGGVFPRKTPNPSSSDPEHEPPIDEIQAWVQAYQSSHHSTKSFTFNKVVSHHNTGYLRSAIQSLVSSTSYRGHLKVSFPVTHSTTKIYSPSRLNTWRFNKYVTWFFYLTFLWIITWPLILLTERKYKPLTIWYPYVYLPYDPTQPRDQSRPHVQPGNQRATRPLVETEERFWSTWNASVRRAVVARHQGWIDGYYRAETEELARNGGLILNTGNSVVDGLFGGALSVARDVQGIVGWGADS